MVRSAPFHPCLAQLTGSGFNSTMVRSARSTHHAPGRIRDVFQFHDGSISTFRHRWRVGRCGRVSIPRWFDQHACVSTAQRRGSRRFNSTMVRSARAPGQGRRGDVIAVSIPRWFDQHSYISDQRHLPGQRFQFHDGSISTAEVANVASSGGHVSIPRWFDQHASRFTEIEILEYRFNSTMVRSAQLSHPVPRRRHPRFNSTMVRSAHDARLWAL